MVGRKPNLDKHPERHVCGDGTVPDCPDWLNADAKTEWERVVPGLAAKFLITTVDMANLAVYCKAYASWKKAEMTLDEEGQTFVDNSGNIKIHPLAKLAVQYLGELRRIAGEFGFSPAARSRIDVPKQPGKDDKDLADFMDQD